MQVKRTLKTLFATLLALICCLNAYTLAFAAEVRGTYTGYDWKFEPDTGTLTLSGEGYGTLNFPSNKQGWWGDYNNQIRHIVLTEEARHAYIPWEGAEVMPNVELYSGAMFGMDWEIDLTNHTLTVNGKGEINSQFKSRLRNICHGYAQLIDRLVIGDGITSWEHPGENLFGLTYETVYLGKSVRAFEGLDCLAQEAYEVSPANPNLSVYDGALYTKDYRKLIGLPLNRPFMKLHPNTKDRGPQIYSGKGDGYSWKYDIASRTLTVSGKNYYDAGVEWARYKLWIDRVILGDGAANLFTEWLTGFDTVVLGKDVSSFRNNSRKVQCNYEVDSRNKYFAAYDGALYTKDYKTLLSVPSPRASLRFHPNLKTVASYAFYASSICPIVLPDGVKTIEEYAFTGTRNPYPIVVLPDSAVTFGDQFARYDDYLAFFYSNRNKAAAQALPKIDRNRMWSEVYSEISWEQLRRDNQAPQTGWHNGYYIDERGRRVVGWKKIDGKLYRFHDTGTKTTNWIGSLGNRQYFGEDGVYQLGWRKVDGKTYYFDEQKGALTGWQDIGGARYYFNLRGEMQTGEQTIKGEKYVFNADGKLKV